MTNAINNKETINLEKTCNNLSLSIEDNLKFIRTESNLKSNPTSNKEVKMEIQDIELFEKDYNELLLKIGKSLKSYRIKSNLKLADVAKQIHIPAEYLESAENGTNIDYSLGLLLKLSMVYKFDLKELF